MHDELILSSDGIFATVQGEGPTMGQPAIFLRLNECNLDCSFCDTAYTWKRDLPEYHERRRVPVEEVRNEILALPEAACRRLVITGGEPLLQERAIGKLLAIAPFPEWQVEIETNGTFVPRSLAQLRHLQLNCSPKLANSGVEVSDRLKPLVLQELASSFNTNFKFVVRGVEDVREIAEVFLPLLGAIERARISVSPEGVDAEQLDRELAVVRPLALSYGFTVGDRLHIRKFGNRRRT